MNCFSNNILLLLLFSVGLSKSMSCVVGVGRCIECQNSTACAVCENEKGYVLSYESKTCIACQKENCIQCSTNSSVCMACADSYGVSNGECVVCSVQNCLKCSLNSSICTNCKSGRGLINNTCPQCFNLDCYNCDSNRSMCKQCEDNFGVVSGGCYFCDGYVQNCNRCSLNARQCTGCKDGFGLIGNTCQQCTNTDCNKCNSNISICTSCKTGFGVSGTTCSVCQKENCILCSTNSSLCTSCSKGFYLIHQFCISYPQFCQICSPTAKCTRCSEFYYVNEDGDCQLCPSNCSKCELDLIIRLPRCTSCFSHYELFQTEDRELCIQTCGDSWTQNYESDNKKNILFDGCDNSCKTMPNFECLNDQNGTTQCIYTGEFQTIISNSFLNESTGNFTIQAYIVPPLYEFNFLTFQELLQNFRINNSGVIIDSITFNQKAGEFTLIGNIDDLNSIAENHHFQLVFTYHNKTSLSLFNFLQHISSNSTQIFYNQAPILQTSMIAANSFAWLNVVIEVLSSTSCGAESVITIQASWFVFKQVSEKIQFSDAIIYPLKFSNGFNFHFGSEGRRLLNISENENHLFLNNFNISFIFLLIPVLLVLISYFRLFFFKNSNPNLQVTDSPNQNQKVKNLHSLVKFYVISWELLLLGCMISVTNFIASAFYFIQVQGFQHQMINLLMVIVGLLVYLLVFFKLRFSTFLFKYTIEAFKCKKFIYVYYTIYLLIIITYVSGPFFLNQLTFSFICIPTISGLFFALFICPYHSILRTIQFFVNILVINLIVFFRIFTQHCISSESSLFSVYGLLAVSIGILPFSQLFNLLITFYNVCNMFFSNKVQCICEGEKLTHEKCMKCSNEKEQNDILCYQNILELLSITKNNIVLSRKSLVSDLDSGESMTQDKTEHHLILSNEGKFQRRKS